MKTSQPMTLPDAAKYLRSRVYFPTLRAATAFLHDVRDDERVRSPGTGDREEFSVEYTTAHRFIVTEGKTSPRPQAGERRPWADSEIPDGALDRALGGGELARLTAFYEAKGDDHYTAGMSARQAMAADAALPSGRTYILAADAYPEPVSGRVRREVLEFAGDRESVILTVGNDDAVDVLEAIRRAYSGGREDRAYSGGREDRAAAITIRRNDVIAVVPDSGPRRTMRVDHVEQHVITLENIPGS